MTLGKNSVQDVITAVGRDSLAETLALQYETYNIQREAWLNEKQELRNYLFATDTRTTTNKILPWKNSTTVPKLTQLRDNLHANYMAALFPNEDWFRWEGSNPDAELEDKRKAITSYMQNKIAAGHFKTEVSKLVYDYIDDGNVFATTEWVSEEVTDEETGETIYGYVGPKIVRLSPNDFLFNPTSATFGDSPKFHRSMVSFGELKKQMLENPLDEDASKLFNMAVEKAMQIRQGIVQATGNNRIDKRKREAYRIDGFGNLQQYYSSGLVEIIDFFGDIYDIATDTYYENHQIRIIDRSFVVMIKPIDKWILKSDFFHVGWRTRPDNLYAMGPLDNLVGMQYRIDHLENLKADVFDMIAFPVFKIRGEVQDFQWRPLEKIWVGDDSDVSFLVPDTAALNADFQIDRMLSMMEELAGAPREAMGIRSPGEKTAFEVQRLENAAGRIFQEKVKVFEEEILEPALNAMLELARRKLDGSDIIRTLGDDTQVALFTTITKEDLKASGRLRATGASHFAKRANIMQNLVQLASSAVGQDPSVNVHISGLRMAKLIEELLNLDKFGLVEQNIRITEQADTQRLVSSVQENLEVEQQIPAGITADEAGLVS